MAKCKMSAETLLEEVSDKYDLNWNDHSMMLVACRYIDSIAQWESFNEFITKEAEEESDL